MAAGELDSVLSLIYNLTRLEEKTKNKNKENSKNAEATYVSWYYVKA